MPQFRGVFESVGFAQQKEQLRGDPQRIDELLSAVTWALARDPWVFPVVPGSALLRIKTSDSAYGLPPLTLYAIVDGPATCTLQWIEETLTEPAPDELTESDLDDLGTA